MYEKQANGYLFSNDKARLQVDVIHNYLCTESYWSRNIPKEVVQASINGSECFAVYHEKKQVGFARVITDNSTFGYMADIFILKEHRGKGLSKILIEFILSHEPFKKFRRFMLATLDAHGLYAQFGFKPLSSVGQYMEKQLFESYPG